MATQETQLIDDVIVSTRRKMLALGGAAIAGLAFAGVKAPAADAQTTTIAYSDADILNFALNLEYLEAQYYTLATAGTTIDQMGIGIGAGTTAGGSSVVTTKNSNNYGSCKVNWQFPYIQAYANETATEERNHVTFLRTALGASAVAQPNLDLYNSFNALAAAINFPTQPFDPFANDIFFLIGAYIFEDLGVTAYNGAAPLLTVSGNLSAAAGILAVEAYHAGLIRTSIFGLATQLSTVNATLAQSLLTATSEISALRMMADGSTTTDDIGVGIQTVALEGASTNVGGSASVGAATVVDAQTGSTNYSKVYSRTSVEVLKIVTGQITAPAAGTKFTGTFFPQGLNSTSATIGLFS